MMQERLKYTASFLCPSAVCLSVVYPDSESDYICMIDYNIGHGRR